MLNTVSENTKTTVCFHCGTECDEKAIIHSDMTFCCDGCKTVYELLNQNKLCSYYHLNEHPGLKINQNLWNNQYAYLDHPDIKKKLLKFTDGNQAHIYLHIPQIHCSSCLWLLENLHRLDSSIVYSRVHFTEKNILIVFEEKRTSLRKVIELLSLIGYSPQLEPSINESGTTELIHKKRLIKIGIAGFCFTNIMMLSLPDYLSDGKLAETELSWLFSFISLTLSLPVLFYCSTEFFINAWNSLKGKFINIDFPIALAILLTFFRSLYEIQSGDGNGYLDSMSGIVFFMLIGRYVQDRSFQSLRYDRDYKSFFPIAVSTFQNNKFSYKPIEQITTGDLVLIHDQEIIPVDGIITKGKANLDYSFVSGERDIIIKNPGELIFAGAKQTGGLLEIQVSKPVSQSYLTSLWNKDVFQNENTTQTKRIDRISQYFSLIVLCLAFTSAAFWFNEGRLDLMWNALTTILIVACPCALLLASSYTNAQILKFLAKNKFYLRHSDVLESISKIHKIVFDKTGTLTKSIPQSLHYKGKELSEDVKLRIYSLASQSTHPLSQALVNYFKFSNPLTVKHFKQVEGKGIEAWIEEHHMKLGSSEYINHPTQNSNTASTIHVMEDGKYLGCFYITQHYRHHLRNTIHNLQRRFILSVISGDNDNDENYLQNIFTKAEHICFKLSPEQKLRFVKDLQSEQKSKVMMIGDGLNDAGALKQSDVGIAITENKNNFTPACDGILDGSSFHKLPQLFQFIKQGQVIIFIIFIYSLIYNIVGSYFALRGQLEPIIAAILMPLSSLTILFLSYCLSGYYAKKYKINADD
jgi:P-type Cu+ transporter